MNTLFVAYLIILFMVQIHVYTSTNKYVAPKYSKIWMYNLKAYRNNPNKKHLLHLNNHVNQYHGQEVTLASCSARICCRVYSQMMSAPHTCTFRERITPSWGISTQTSSSCRTSTGIPSFSFLNWDVEVFILYIYNMALDRIYIIYPYNMALNWM